jgi:hypothetical protein
MCCPSPQPIDVALLLLLSGTVHADLVLVVIVVDVVVVVVDVVVEVVNVVDVVEVNGMVIVGIVDEVVVSQGGVGFRIEFDDKN